MSLTTREKTIRYVLPNLHYRWPQLKAIDDNQVAELYENFAMSDEHGNNDALFPAWVKEVFDLDLD